MKHVKKIRSHNHGRRKVESIGSHLERREFEKTARFGLRVGSEAVSRRQCEQAAGASLAETRD